MLRKNLRTKVIANTIGLVAASGSLFAFAAPAVANPECVQYARSVCLLWDELGYSSEGECRLAEYDICVAGGAASRNFNAAFLKTDSQ